MRVKTDPVPLWRMSVRARQTHIRNSYRFAICIWKVIRTGTIKNRLYKFTYIFTGCIICVWLLLY